MSYRRARSPRTSVTAIEVTCVLLRLAHRNFEWIVKLVSAAEPKVFVEINGHVLCKVDVSPQLGAAIRMSERRVVCDIGGHRDMVGRVRDRFGWRT